MGRPCKRPSSDIPCSSQFVMFTDIRRCLFVFWSYDWGDIDILYDKYLIPNQPYTGGPDGALNVAVTLLQFHLWPRREHVKNIAEPVGRTMSPPP
jgi:hypothetical protein